MKIGSVLHEALGLSLACVIMFSCASSQDSNNERKLIPNIFLDHFYIVVDSMTYNAIKESKYITDTLCMFQEDTISTQDDSWTGAYLHGEKNYIEIFNPGGFENAKEGTVGIGFSTTRVGDIEIVRNRYKELFGQSIESRLSYFVEDTLEFPCYYSIESDSGEDISIATWVMEYHPSELEFMGIIPDSEGFFSRNEYMAAMNKMIDNKKGRLNEPLLFEAITSISLVLTPNELERLKKDFAAISFSEKIEDNATIFQGPEIVVSCTIEPDPKYRIRSLELSLSRKPESEVVLPLGSSSVLTISTDGTGLWAFGYDLYE